MHMRHFLRLTRFLCRLALATMATTAAGAAGNAQDLSALLDSVVTVEASVPADARTAETLGTARAGSGVVIDDSGLVLTIGYLILEADQVELSTATETAIPADIVAYDYDTGFGLLRALQPLGAKPIRFGRSEDLHAEDHALVLSRTIAPAAQGVIVADRRRFAGYWEYLLDDAIFTAPPHREYGGAALIGADGTLRGIGSLFVGDVYGGERGVPGNMFVPIDALKPILSDLLALGRSTSPAKPWLGIFAEEERGHLFVVRVAGAGPAAKAGIKVDDIIVRVGEEPVTSLAEFYLAVWARGDAGVEVPLTILRGGETREVKVGSGNRYDYLRLRSSY